MQKKKQKKGAEFAAHCNPCEYVYERMRVCNVSQYLYVDMMPTMMLMLLLLLLLLKHIHTRSAGSGAKVHFHKVA